MIPPFFIPILAFLLWAGSLLGYFPVLKLELRLIESLIAPQLFISCLILVLAWAFSGPITATVLTLLSAVAALYLALSLKEPVLFFQIVIYAALFVGVVSFLYKIQRRTNDRALLREKCVEEITVHRDERMKKITLKEALQKKIGRLLDLQRFSGELKALTDLNEAAGGLVLEVLNALPKAGECVLYLVDDSRQKLSLIAGARLNGEPVKEKDGTLFDTWVMKRSVAVMVEDSQNDFRFPSESRASLKHLRSLCVSPLVTENKVLGVIRLSADRPGVFTGDDLRLLDIFASLGAVTLQNILLMKRMEELAIRDGLTGLYLNRYFQERLSGETERSRAGDYFYSLILMDVDHFKNYNDEFGHAAGDIVLKNVARILTQCLEPVDLAARYGGEEFVVLLPNKNKKEALNLAERIRSEIQNQLFSFRRVERRITVSLGVATFPKEGQTREEILWKADKCLYEAKNAGRNRVCGSI